MSDVKPVRSGPYVGLIPYSEEDAPLFFGRERERDIINSNLLGARLTLLYGPTGAGKTSILRAGVKYHLNYLAEENRKKLRRPELAVVVFNKWQGDPLLNLRKDLKEAVERAMGRALKSEESPKSAPNNDGGESAFAHTIDAYSELIDGDVLIILDQFEEYFLYHGQSGETPFSKAFAHAVNRTASRAGFLISIREDALAKLDYFKGKIPELFSNYLRVKHLSIEAARAAITEPLRVYSGEMGADPPYSIEPELVDAVCEQIKPSRYSIADAGPGVVEIDSDADRVETSYLQLVMKRLWEYETNHGKHRLHLQTLKTLGGAANILQTHLDVNLTGSSPEEQEVAAAIFHYLVTPSGTKVAYTASDLAQLTKLPEERVEAVLENLCAGDTRILRTYYLTERSGRSVKNYEIYHDVLANAVLGWRAWYQRDQDRRRAVREAKEAERQRQRAEEEERRSQEQRRQKRATRRIQLLFLIVGFATVIAAVFYFQSLKAEKAAREAQDQRAVAQALLDTVDSIDRGVAFFKAVMRGHKESVLGVDFSPDQTHIVTASADSTARIWNISIPHARSAVAILIGHRSAVRSALYSPDGRLIATASDDRTARAWDARTGQLLHVLTGHEKEVSAARFSPDSRFIVTASADGTARVWDAATGQQTALFSNRSADAAHAVTYAAFSPDGQRVVTGGADGAVRVWESGSFTLLGSHANEVNTAVFSRDGKLVVTASSDGEARIWDATTGQSYPLKGHKEPVNSAAFSPDGTLVVTASDDRTARIWDLKTRQTSQVLEGHTDAVSIASFSFDGTRVITASADRTARVWEVSSGRVLFELRGNAAAVNQAVFSPKNARLAATASADNTARVWDIGGSGGLRIADISVKVAPDDYEGLCPIGVKLSADITAEGSGTITYRFVRSDGVIGVNKTLNFEGSGTKTVSTTWRFGARPSRSFSGNVQLEITSGQPYQRKEARYSVQCISRPSQAVTTPVTPVAPTSTPPPTQTPTPPAPPPPAGVPE
jgi:WD40 repeat protein